MNKSLSRSDHRAAAMGVSVALFLMLAGAVLGQSANTPTESIAFVVAADLNGDGFDEVIVGLEAWSEPHIAEFSLPGDVYVYEHNSPLAVTSDLHQVFQCRSSIPETYLSAFFQPSLISIADLDNDSLPEVVIVWYEQYWWPTAYRPLSVLQFNPEDGSYELAIDAARFVGEIGGYAVEDVDLDGVPEIVEIDPVYGTETNPMSGVEEWECHYCPHRYGVRIIGFDGGAFHVDPALNGGDVYVTADKYLPDAAWEATSSFLPEILEQVRSMVQGQSIEPDA